MFTPILMIPRKIAMRYFPLPNRGKRSRLPAARSHTLIHVAHCMDDNIQRWLCFWLCLQVLRTALYSCQTTPLEPIASLNDLPKPKLANGLMPEPIAPQMGAAPLPISVERCIQGRLYGGPNAELPTSIRHPIRYLLLWLHT